MNKIYEAQKTTPPSGEIEKMIYIDEEKIYSLRNQGKTYKEIAKYFVDNGIKISACFIRKRCKQIYQEKGEIEPTVAEAMISDEKLVELTELGFNFSQISRYLTDMNTPIAVSTVSNRCKEIYRKKGIPIPKVERGWKPLGATVINDKILELVLNNLRESRRATDIQLKILAKEYNIHWDYALDADNFDNIEDEER